MEFAKRLIRTPAKKLQAALRWQKAALTNMTQPPPVFVTGPADAPAGLRVHLGAGEINLQGWVNVDARAMAHIHVNTMSLSLDEFADGAAGIIYMCHVLEHLSFDDASSLLTALNRKLVTGGIIMISVPDFDAIVRIYNASSQDLDAIKHPLMGGQGYEYNFHRSVYNRAALAALLGKCGYANVQTWEAKAEFGADIGDWSSTSIRAGNGDRVPISLNLKARRPGGGR